MNSDRFLDGSTVHFKLDIAVWYELDSVARNSFIALNPSVNLMFNDIRDKLWGASNLRYHQIVQSFLQAKKEL